MPVWSVHSDWIDSKPGSIHSKLFSKTEIAGLAPFHVDPDSHVGRYSTRREDLGVLAKYLHQKGLRAEEQTYAVNQNGARTHVSYFKVFKGHEPLSANELWKLARDPKLKDFAVLRPSAKRPSRSSEKK